MCICIKRKHVHFKRKLRDFEPFSTVVWVFAPGSIRSGPMQVSFNGVSRIAQVYRRQFFKVYFWYVVLQDFIQSSGIYFLHENVFYFLKANYDTKMLPEDVYFAFSFFQ